MTGGRQASGPETHRAREDHASQLLRPDFEGGPGTGELPRSRIALLLRALGIDDESFDRILEFVLSERLVAEMANHPSIGELIGKKDELKRFRDLLSARTGMSWTLRDTKSLLARVKSDRATHVRDPIPAEEALLLRLSSPLVCARCGRRPPEVVLHMDHVVPASKGGPSKRQNLQFLCMSCNLKKSNKREVGNPWLLLQ
jgi:hypothetical protein